jgi:Flp pilus assembly protein TadD
VIGVVIAGIVALAFWQPWRGDLPLQESNAPSRTGPQDPRLSFSTPYRNVRPEVKYVGDAACAACHVKETDAYHSHPMAHSMSTVAEASPLERYDAAAHNPFTAGVFTYRIDPTGGIRHFETVADRTGRVVAETEARVSHAVGSGRNGRAYLIDRDGYLFASPITWYPRKQTWDLAPGYEKINPHFGRAIIPSCLFCHANQADHISGTANRYRPANFHGEAIGCERCHGPGELHVQRRAGGIPVTGLDDTIVNPSRLEHSLREAVCQQCHLQGHQRVLRRGCDTFDYRPGLPFQLFMSDFVEPPEEPGEAKFVGSVEQMYASRCFQGGTGPGKMGCISCHDPHSVPPPERKVAFYRDRCMTCHKDRGCSLPLAARPGNDCVACHMPPTGSDLRHTTITDHRVLRRPEDRKPNLPVANARPDQRPALKEATLVNFHAHLLPTPGPEDNRDLAIALIREAERRKPTGTGRGLVARALPLLDAAIQRDGDDVVALESRGNALWDLGKREEAAADYERVLKLAPDQEATLFAAAELAQRRGQLETARSYAERAIRVNPWRWEYHMALARMLAQANDWQSAARECREVFKLHATELGARRLLVTCYLRMKKKEDAKREFDTLMDLGPPQPDELRRWFAEQMRGT